MRLFPIAAVIVLVTACQTTTAPVTQAGPAKALPQAGCSESEAREYAQIDQRIAVLNRQTARGYRTSSTVVRVANPLKLCKGVVPLVSVCLPTPKPKSTLPTYQEHQAMKKEMKTLKSRKAALSACAK
ncbi:hypothetical protein J3R80_03470 [Aliiroseovarius sp. Z3]|uniref:hypothetical protein n=1 Tax=Aliiroseovarius sp. Z3 TaxID=2811402 RepID=UPI0023B2DB5B|nr:hypothetical protein [Aliiroseovarius sp. Z3]MDE9449526.1 hypothetical protein [Aliiroseovarius sp. Z3]